MQLTLEGQRCRVRDEVDSTNAEAVRCIAAGAREGWVAARRQSCGRGRRGRSWVSCPGNLFASHWQIVDESPAMSVQRSFVAALALRDGITGLLPAGPPVTLKWPNDVLIDGCKVAGILLENISKNSVRHVVTGFGVNLAAAPALTKRSSHKPRVASVLDLADVAIAPLDFLRVLAAAFRFRNSQLLLKGFAEVRDEWLNHAHWLNEPVRVVGAGNSFNGIFRSIDRSGRAVVERAGRPEFVAAADMGLAGMP